MCTVHCREYRHVKYITYEYSFYDPFTQNQVLIIKCSKFQIIF